MITIDALAPKAGMPLYFSWDDHANAQPGWDMAQGMKLRATDMDPALSTLIDDLYDRGLDPHQTFTDFAGRPILILSDGTPIRELI